MMTTPMIVSVEVSIMLSVCWRLCATLSMSLVTRLRRSPRGWLSTYASGKAVELVLDVAAQLRHRSLHGAGEDEALGVRQEAGDDVDEQHLQQHHVQLAEVDALRALDAGDDDVGGVAEDAGPDDGQRDADDREQEHRGDAQPLGREAVQEPPDRALEVLRLLDRHPDAEAGARVHRDALAGFGDLVLGLLLAAVVAGPRRSRRAVRRCRRCRSRRWSVMPRPPRRRTATRRSPGTWGRTRAGRGACRGRRCGPPRARGSGRPARSWTRAGRRSR